MVVLYADREPSLDVRNSSESFHPVPGNQQLASTPVAGRRQEGQSRDGRLRKEEAKELHGIQGGRYRFTTAYTSSCAFWKLFY